MLLCLLKLVSVSYLADPLVAWCYCILSATCSTHSMLMYCLPEARASGTIHVAKFLFGFSMHSRFCITVLQDGEELDPP